MSQDYEPRKRGLDPTAEAGMNICYSLDQIVDRLERIASVLNELRLTVELLDTHLQRPR